MIELRFVKRSVIVGVDSDDRPIYEVRKILQFRYLEDVPSDWQDVPCVDEGD